jgi:hypothetical protein
MSVSNIIEYKHHLAELELDTEDNIIVGRVGGESVSRTFIENNERCCIKDEGKKMAPRCRLTGADIKSP